MQNTNIKPQNQSFFSENPFFFSRKASVVLKKIVILWSMKKSRKQALNIYLIFWILVVLLVPLELFYHYAAGHDAYLHWREVGYRLLAILPFLVLFLVHHFLLLPVLHRPQKGWRLTYVLLLLLLLAVFALYCFLTVDTPPGVSGDAPPDGPRPLRPELMRSMIGVLVVVADLGISAFLRSMDNERRMQELREETLRQQMETLRYQINPHFFMNTLNNIHALVDIDGEKAKESIEAFSKMLRMVLYEDPSPTVPLQRELELIGHYVSLMQLRYPPSVDISLDLPDDPGDAVIPPLSLVSVVENAFKHGISYKAPSFIHIRVRVGGGEIRFECDNSRNGAASGEARGIGMENVRRRFGLLYGAACTIEVLEDAASFRVRMVIPCHI